MAVLLEGINIPEGNPITINIYRDGTWVNAYTTEDGNAIEVPEPHGDLIDASEAYDKIAEQEGGNYVDMDAVGMGLDETPTVIPASEEG